MNWQEKYIAVCEKKDLMEERIKQLEEENKRLVYLCKTTLFNYAWMKDGVMYVGTTGTRYKDALAELEEEIKALEGK